MCWRSIITSRDFLRRGAYFKLGDRSSIDFWNDPWISDLCNFVPIAK